MSNFFTLGFICGILFDIFIDLSTEFAKKIIERVKKMKGEKKNEY